MANGVGGLPTLSGYRFDEALSALQKMIRRGHEREAMHWAIELESSFHKHLWNRLEIIVHEDIGLANPILSIYVRTTKEQYMEMRERKSSATRMLLANVILAMCRSEKSRLGDDFCITAYKTHERIPVPDVAKDKHTEAGRRMGRGYEHFFSEGSFLDRESSEVSNPYVNESHRLIMEKVPFKDTQYRGRANLPESTDALIESAVNGNSEMQQELF
jgi:replication-associated recombination protein RarA